MHFQRRAALLLLIVAVGAISLLPCASSALMSRRFVDFGDSGFSVVTQTSEAAPADITSFFSPKKNALGPSVYFEQNSTISIYEHVAISMSINQIAAGSWLSDDSMAEAVSLQSGSQVWKESHDKGTFFEVAASRVGHIIVSGQFDNYGQNNSATLTARDQSGKVLWSLQNDGIRAGMKSLSMSPSGNTLAALLSLDSSYIQPGFVRLHCIRADNGQVYSKFDTPRGPDGAISLSEVTENGIVAFIAGFQLYVFDCSANKLLANITRNYIDGTLSISSDGRQIATGFETFELWTLSSAGSFEQTANIKLVNPSRTDAKLWCLQAAAYSPVFSTASKSLVAIGAFDCYTAKQNFVQAFMTDSTDGSGNISQSPSPSPSPSLSSLAPPPPPPSSHAPSITGLGIFFS